MLNYTFMRLMTARPSTQEEQLDVNPYMKSFAVHALNLIEFLCDKSWTDDHGASNYVPDFEPPDQAAVKQALSRLEKQIPRVGTSSDSRAARQRRASSTPGSCPLLKFHGELAPPYLASLGAVAREASEQ